MSTQSICKKIGETIQALGIVFGDIGTSPIYTMVTIFLLIPPTQENIFGVLSIIIWMLILLVSVQYTWLAMSLSQDKEGGTLVLGKIIRLLLKSNPMIAVTAVLSYIGSSLLIGDGIITPAISILSAVEGLRFIPAIAPHINQQILVILASIISLLLFAFQRKGTENVGIAFGPIMLVWFLTIGISGLIWVIQEPSVLQVLNPLHIFYFFKQNALGGFLILSHAVLSVTGGEALYADMGHLGRFPIIRAWTFAFVLLTLCYLGQGAYLLHHPTSKHVFFEMIFGQIDFLALPFQILSIFATVIASQAIISGIFSVVYQGITTQIMPKFKIEYTSRKLKSQIYISTVNWALFLFVLVVIIRFQTYESLANLYGLSTICTMIITGILMSAIFFLQKLYIKAGVASIITVSEIFILSSSTAKIAYGGYWTFIIAFIPLSLIIIYTRGKKRLYEALKPTSLYKFLDQYNEQYKKAHLLPGTALFLSKTTATIPYYILRIMFLDEIIYQDNILLSTIILNKPFGIHTEFIDLAPGIRIFEIRAGYMEIVNLPTIFRQVNLDPKVIFYGMEEIETKKIMWKIFALIKKLTPSFVTFYKLPTDKLHGVLQQVKI